MDPPGDFSLNGKVLIICLRVCSMDLLELVSSRNISFGTSRKFEGRGGLTIEGEEIAGDLCALLPSARGFVRSLYYHGDVRSSRKVTLAIPFHYRFSFFTSLHLTHNFQCLVLLTAKMLDNGCCQRFPFIALSLDSGFFGSH